MKYLLIAFTIFSLLSCEKEDDGRIIIDDEEIQFEMIFDNHHVFMEDEMKTLLFKSEEDQNRYLNSAKTLNQFAWDVINYEEEMVIGIVLPAEPSGGNRLTIKSLKVIDGIVHVESILTRCGMTTDIGHPAYFVKLNKIDNDIEFLDLIIDDCGYLDHDGKIENKTWYLYEYQMNGAIYNSRNSNIDLRGFWFEIQGVDLVGQAYCNAFTADYVSKANSAYKFMNWSNTEAACTLSDEFMSSMYNSEYYQFDEQNQLVINNREGPMSVMTFRLLD